jgi:hypothetical protein
MINILPEFLALLLLREVQESGALEITAAAEQAGEIREKVVGRIPAGRIEADFDFVHKVLQI